MAQVDLRGNIILDGHTTSGFDAIAGKVQAWAQQIQVVGDKIWDFEKESLGIYKDYETNMLKARAAMSSTYDNAAELDKVMDTLGEHVQDWAVNSIFHVSDFSGAVNNAAHAGWTLEQQLEGIPRAMLLAQAGGLDLSSGLEYLARALNVTGTDFKDSGTLVDQWVKASHLANLTIEDLGESLNRMGVTAQLTDSTAELFTMLDALANTGSVGSEAGTLLRGTIMRLIAPTKKATEAMESLEVTQEELADLAGDSEALKEANKLLEAQGFSAYDTNGQLKPLMQTYGELYDALVAIAGSEEDLLTNSEVDKILAAIFPQRQISGALSFLQAVKGGWDELYESIVNSEGEAQADADTVMSGLMGAQEKFLSKWEEFKRSVGEELSGPFETILGFLGEAVDKLNALPEEQLDALVGGLTGIAGLGSLLGAGSGVMFFFSHLGPGGVAALIAAAGVGALYGYLKKTSELDFESKFGTMAIDVEKLNDSLEKFTLPDQEARDQLTGVTAELVAATEAYNGYAEAFAQELKIDTLTNKKLTKDDLDALVNLGDDMQKAVIKGIKEGAKQDRTIIDSLFDVGDQADYDALTDEQRALYDSLMAANEGYFSQLEIEAYQVGAELRKMLTAALNNPDLTAEDEAAIMAQVQRYNDIIAKINAYQRDIDMRAALKAAQRMSWDNYDTMMTGWAEDHARHVEEINNEYDNQLALFEKQFEEGYYKGYRDDKGVWHTPEQQYREQVALVEGYEDENGKHVAGKREAEIASVDEYYGSLAREGTDSMLYNSDYGDVWKLLMQGQAGNVQFGENGKVDYSDLDLTRLDTDALKSLNDQIADLNANSVMFESKMNEFSGNEDVQNRINLLESLDYLQQLVDNEIRRRDTLDTETPGGVDKYGRAAAEHTDELTDENALRTVIVGKNLEVANAGFDLYSDAANQYHQAVTRMRELGYDVSSYINNSTDDWYRDYLYEHRNDSRQAGLDYLNATKQAEEDRLERLQGQKADVESDIETRESRMQEKGNWQDWWYSFTNGLASDYTALHGGTAQTDGGLYGKQEQLGADIEEAKSGIQAVQGVINAFAAMGDGVSVDTVLNADNVQEQLDTIGDEAKLPVEVEADAGGLQGTLNAMGGGLHLPVADGTPIQQQLENQGVEVEVYGDTAMLDATIQAEDGQILMQYIDGNADDLHMAIWDENGQTLIENVTGDPSSLASIINQFDGKTIHVNIVGNRMFAEGGRATEPSIFGEVPGQAEWAIPEAHTERTAQLLNAAREASGFTWDEIIGRYGGLNGNPNHVNVNLSYSPTINATNADGVEAVLEKDKSRIISLVQEAVKRALNSAKLHDDLEVYA